MTCKEAIADPKIRQQYKDGNYKFDAPPVCTSYWTEDDWICYITKCNGWVGYQ